MYFNKIINSSIKSYFMFFFEDYSSYILFNFLSLCNLKEVNENSVDNMAEILENSQTLWKLQNQKVQISF